MDIAIRASVTFFFLWIIVRAMGKRELSEMTSFELVLLVVTGDLIQQGVTQEDYSLTGSLVAVSTFGLWVLVLSYVSFRWRRARVALDGAPVIVIRNGRVLDEAIQIERLTREELLEEARMSGIGDLEEIEVGILEPDGKFSFITSNPKTPNPAPDKGLASG